MQKPVKKICQLPCFKRLLQAEQLAALRLAIGEAHGHALRLRVTGIKIGVAFGLRPVKRIAPARQAGKRKGHRLDLVNHRDAILFKQAVGAAFHGIANLFPFLGVGKGNLRAVGIPGLLLQAAVNAGAFQRALIGNDAFPAFQISAAQQKFHQLPHGNTDFRHLAPSSRFLQV